MGFNGLNVMAVDDRWPKLRLIWQPTIFTYFYRPRAGDGILEIPWSSCFGMNMDEPSILMNILMNICPILGWAFFGWTYAPPLNGMGLEDDVQPVMWLRTKRRENRRRFTSSLCSSCDMLGLWWKATFGTGQFKFYLWNQRRWGF